MNLPDCNRNGKSKLTAVVAAYTTQKPISTMLNRKRHLFPLVAREAARGTASSIAPVGKASDLQLTQGPRYPESEWEYPKVELYHVADVKRSSC